MLELSASGDVFTFNGALVNDTELTRQKVAAGARLHFAGELQFCHGVDVELSVKALAELTGESPPAPLLEQFPILILTTGMAHGEAFLGVGGRAKANFMVDLFDSFGFNADASAHAKAAVAGRLSVGLSMQAIAAAARSMGPLLNSAAYDIFIAFLNELVVEAGVWGEANVSAYAEATLSIKGSLSDDENAGFSIESAMGAGYAVGTSWDFYAGARFKQPKRFYLYATDRITRLIAAQARKVAPSQVQPLIPVLELVLPILLNSAYEIAQTTVLAALSDRESTTKAFVRAFIGEVQRFLIDRIVEAGAALLREWIEATADAIAAGLIGQPLDEEQRQTLHTQIQDTLDLLRDKPVSWDTALLMLTPVIECLTVLVPDHIEEWRQPLAVLWTAATTAQVLHTGSESLSAEATATFAGFADVTAQAVLLPLPEAPAVVAQDWAATLGEGITVTTVAEAFTYLIETGVATAIHVIDPELQTLFDLFEARTGFTSAEVIEGVMRGVIGRDLTHTELYRRLRDFAKESVDHLLLTDLLPELRRTLGPSNDATLWIDEVADPTLRLSSSFVFGRLDAFVDGTIALSDLSPAFYSFRAALSHLVAKIVTRNVVVLADILLSHVHDQLHDSLLLLEQAVRHSPNHPMAQLGQQLSATLLPANLALAADLGPATQDLVADLLAAGAAAFGPQTLTTAHRAKQRHLMIRIVDSIDGEVDHADGAAVDRFFRSLAECAYIPDPEALGELLMLDAELLAQITEILLPRVADALSRFSLRVTRAAVQDLDRLARDFVRQVAQALQGLVQALQACERRVVDAVAQVAQAVAHLARQVQRLVAALDDPQNRTKVLDALRQSGIDQALTTVESAPGFDLQPRAVREQEIGAAVTAFTTPFDLARPLLADALRCLGHLADTLATVAGTATTPSSLEAAVAGEIKAAVSAAVNAATGLTLPPQLTADGVGQIAADTLLAVQAVRSALQDAWDATRARIDAAKAEGQARQDRSLAQGQLDAGRERSGNLIGETPDIRIMAPVPMGRRHPVVYAATVEAVVVVRGARPSYVQPGAPRRIFMALNGTEVPISRWSPRYVPGVATFVFRSVFSVAASELRPGLNTLECSVADGSRELRREKVVFAVNTAVPTTGLVEIDTWASQFNVPGDDHARAEAETVAIRNAGSRELELRGWSLRDAAGHRYPFGDCSLSPGHRVIVHTGIGQDVTTSVDLNVYQGRRRAVWNNAGDVVLVSDPGGVVRAAHTYLAEEGY